MIEMGGEGHADRDAVRGAKRSDTRRYREHLQRCNAPGPRGRHQTISVIQWTGSTVAAIAGVAVLAGCAVVGVAGAVVGTAVSVTGTVVGTGVKVVGKVVEKTVDIVTPSGPK